MGGVPQMQSGYYVFKKEIHKLYKTGRAGGYRDRKRF